MFNLEVVRLIQIREHSGRVIESLHNQSESLFMTYSPPKSMY